MDTKFVRVNDVRLNGGAAQWVLGPHKMRGVAKRRKDTKRNQHAMGSDHGSYSYNDVDLLFLLDFEKSQFESAFTAVRKCLMLCLREFMPPGVNKKSLTLDMLCHAYVQKQVMIPARWEVTDILESGRTDFDCWSLLSLRCLNGPFLEFKFCQKMARQYEFDTDSCQIILTEQLLNQCSPQRSGNRKKLGKERWLRTKKVNAYAGNYDSDESVEQRSSNSQRSGNLEDIASTEDAQKRRNTHLAVPQNGSPAPSDILYDTQDMSDLQEDDSSDTISAPSVAGMPQEDDASDPAPVDAVARKAQKVRRKSCAALCESDDDTLEVPAPATKPKKRKKPKSKKKGRNAPKNFTKSSSESSASDVSDSEISPIRHRTLPTSKTSNRIPTIPTTAPTNSPTNAPTSNPPVVTVNDKKWSKKNRRQPPINDSLEEPGQTSTTLPRTIHSRRDEDSSSSYTCSDDEECDDESDVWVECLSGSMEDVEFLIRNKVINIAKPECVRGGGFLKYCDLLSQGYQLDKSWSPEKTNKMEIAMHNRFCIDFPRYAKVVYQLNMYVEAHFRSGKDDLHKFFCQMMKILHKLYKQNIPHSSEMTRWVYHIMCLYFNNRHSGLILPPMTQPQPAPGMTLVPAATVIDSTPFVVVPNWSIAPPPLGVTLVPLDQVEPIDQWNPRVYSPIQITPANPIQIRPVGEA